MSVYERGIELDADEVVPGLWVGSKLNMELSYKKWSAIVLCADLLQQRPPHFRGTLLRAPFGDTPWPTERETQVILAAVDFVVRMRKEFAPTLVTCHAGLNRSALVTGLAMHRLGLYGDGENITRLLRRARGEAALCNKEFARWVWQGSP